MMRLINLKVASLVISTMFIGGSVSADTIRFWTIEDKPPRLAKQQAMANDFKALTGHDVEVIPIEEKDLGGSGAGDLENRVRAAVVHHQLLCGIDVRGAQRHVVPAPDVPRVSIRLHLRLHVSWLWRCW